MNCKLCNEKSKLTLLFAESEDPVVVSDCADCEFRYFYRLIPSEIFANLPVNTQLECQMPLHK